MIHLFIIGGLLGVAFSAAQIIRAIVYTQMMKALCIPERSIFTQINTPHDSILIESESGVLDIIIHHNPKASQTVLYFHGNSGRVPETIQELTKTHSVLSVAYPGFHRSQGKPTEQNILQAAEKVFQYATKTLDISPQNIIIFGHSMGGFPATFLASNHPEVSKLVLVNTFASAAHMVQIRHGNIIGFFAIQNLFNTSLFAPNVQCPVHQFHVRNDIVIPVTEGQKLFSYFAETDAEFTELEHGTHVVFNGLEL